MRTQLKVPMKTVLMRKSKQLYTDSWYDILIFNYCKNFHSKIHSTFFHTVSILQTFQWFCILITSEICNSRRMPGRELGDKFENKVKTFRKTKKSVKLWRKKNISTRSCFNLNRLLIRNSGNKQKAAESLAHFESYNQILIEHEEWRRWMMKPGFHQYYLENKWLNV